MTIKKTQLHPSQDDVLEILVPEDQEGTELYDSPTPDSYDPHLIPSETAARKEREGDNFKRLPKHPAGSESLDTTGGFVVDKEGLVDNFGIEPDMYYKKPGDLRAEVEQQTRADGYVSELRQDELRQEALRQEALRQEFKQRGVGIFSSYETTEIALVELKNTGFLMDRVSVVGRDINSHTEVTGSHLSNRMVNVGNLDTNENKAEEIAKDGAIAGSTVGVFTGLLVGLGLVAIPGVGPVMLAGAVATAIASTISGGVIGAAAGSLAGGLMGLGMSEDRAKVYSDRVAHGDYLVMVEGSEADMALAESIFKNHHIHDWHIYDLPHNLVRAVTTSSTH
jgi:hypothetical protein